jgi:hypothetical protein
VVHILKRDIRGQDDNEFTSLYFFKGKHKFYFEVEQWKGKGGMRTEWGIFLSQDVCSRNIQVSI